MSFEAPERTSASGSEERWPHVSIVIPTRNAGERLRKVLAACMKQTYAGTWEIIVVDNGSVDNTKAIALEWGQVRLLEENEYLGSPYSARNRGIQAAQGEIVALLDSSCVPRRDWLGNGVGCMERLGSGLVAGEVVFDVHQAQASAGELWDSLTNIRQESAVSRGRAKTANLFVHRSVLAAQGLFREGTRSGEDVRWTADAAAAGWPLTYARDAIVEKDARGGYLLLKKAARTGAGRAALTSPPRRVAMGLAMLLVPPAIWRVRRLLQERNIRLATGRLTIAVWLVAWSARVSHGLGLLFPGALRRVD